MPEQANQVLVIDDDPVIRRLIVTVAREAGYTTSETANGAEALEMVEKGDFRLLILDLMLPGLSGQDVLERLEPVRGCSIIIVTAGDDHDVNEIDSRFVCDIIRKPFDIHDLRNAIKRAMEDEPADQAEQPSPLLQVRSSRSPERESAPPASSKPDDDRDLEQSSAVRLAANDDVAD